MLDLCRQAAGFRDSPYRRLLSMAPVVFKGLVVLHRWGVGKPIFGRSDPVREHEQASHADAENGERARRPARQRGRPQQRKHRVDMRLPRRDAGIADIVWTERAPRIFVRSPSMVTRESTEQDFALVDAPSRHDGLENIAT